MLCWAQSLVILFWSGLNSPSFLKRDIKLEMGKNSDDVTFSSPLASGISLPLACSLVFCSAQLEIIRPRRLLVQSSLGNVHADRLGGLFPALRLLLGSYMQPPFSSAFRNFCLVKQSCAGNKEMVPIFLCCLNAVYLQSFLIVSPVLKTCLNWNSP